MSTGCYGFVALVAFSMGHSSYDGNTGVSFSAQINGYVVRNTVQTCTMNFYISFVREKKKKEKKNFTVVNNFVDLSNDLVRRI